MSDSLRPHGLYPARLLCPWDSPGKNAGVGCQFLLQGIFPTQESNSRLLHCSQILYRLGYEGSPIGASILKELQKPLKHVPLPSGSNSVQKACSQGVKRPEYAQNTLRGTKLDTAQVSLPHLSRREIEESQRQLALHPRVGWGLAYASFLVGC